MRAGKLRHRVMIQRLGVATQDPLTGDLEAKWFDLAKVAASIEPVSVRSYIQSAMAQKEVSTRIVMRYRDVDTRDRVVYRGKTYAIQGILADPKSGREYLTLLCQEKGAI